MLINKAREAARPLSSSGLRGVLSLSFFKRRVPVWVGLSLFFLSSRLIVLFFSPYLYHRKENFIGTIAQEIIMGLRFDFFAWQFRSYHGGSLLVGLLAVPFYKIFGPSVFSLKLVALLFSWATFCLVISFMRRQFGQRTALVAAVLFILSPNYYIRWNLQTLGVYTEPLFTVAVMSFFLSVVLKKESPRSYLIFGLLCGFSIWFSYINLFAVVACGLCWFFCERRRPRPCSVFFIPGLLIGLGPWFYYNLRNGFFGVSDFVPQLVRSQTIPEKASIFLTNARELLPHVFPALYRFLDVSVSCAGRSLFTIDRRIMAFAYHGVFLVSFAGLLFSLRKRFNRAAFFLALYVVLYAAVFCFSDYNQKSPVLDFSANLRQEFYEHEPGGYLFLLLPFVIMTISVALGRLSEAAGKGLQLLGKGIFVLLITIGLLGYVSLLDFSEVNGVQRFIGLPYDFSDAMEAIAYHNSRPDFIKSVVPKLRQGELPMFYYGLGVRKFNDPYWRDDKIIKGDLSQIVGEEHRSDYFRGVGAELVETLDACHAFLPEILKLEPRDRDVVLLHLKDKIRTVDGKITCP